jgi:pilus assembly protein CpaB
VKVLSTDSANNAKDNKAAAQAVNLLVTPEQAEVLSLAIVQNRIQLVLRNPLDDSSISDTIAKEIKPALPVIRIPHAAPPPPEKKVEAPPAPRPLPTVEIVQGTKRTVTVVAPSASKEVTQ